MFFLKTKDQTRRQFWKCLRKFLFYNFGRICL